MDGLDTHLTEGPESSFVCAVCEEKVHEDLFQDGSDTCDSCLANEKREARELEQYWRSTRL